MTEQQKRDLIFKLWLNSGMTKTEFAIRCGWKNSSNFCGMISGRHRVTYEHLEKACKVLDINFKVEIQ
jgi:hypothetical protein